MWLGIFSVLSASSFILSILATFYAARNAIRLRELRATLRPLPLSRLQSLETSQAEMLAELQAIANRMKMRDVRAAANHVGRTSGPSADPDPYKDPDAWRKMMNTRLAQAKLGGNQP